MTRVSARPELVFALVGAVLIAGVIVSLVVGGGSAHGGGGSGSAPASAATPVATDAAPSVTETPAATQAPAVDSADVTAALSAYATAFDDEDTSELGLLLADTITRTSNGVERDGIGDVLAEYQSQFDVLADPAYTLSSVDITPEDGGATVAAYYSITSSNAPEATGTIAFHLSETDSGLLIDSISAESDG
jgi:hypothetical protein